MKTPEPVWRGTTNEELVEYILELRKALKQCNADKEALKSINTLK